MATIQERKRKDGSSSYRVFGRIKKRLHGETFSGPDAADAAADFAALVDRIGMEAAKAVRDERSGRNRGAVPTVAEWAHRHVDELTGITDGTRADYHRIIRKTIEGTELGALPLDAAKRTHVRRWVREQEKTKPRPAAKTIRNRHGLLSAAFASAIEEEMREDNPCKGTQIAETERAEMVFLTREEFELVLDYMRPLWRPLAVALVGTGARFSEITALPAHAVHLNDKVPNIRLERAWKWISNSKAELGPPKTRKGRRTVYLGEQIAAAFKLAVDGRAPDDLVFSTASGKRITRSNFHDLAWQPALRAAMATHEPDGAAKPPQRILTKKPRVHDLRHTYASWQIAAGTPLNIIRDQLGHESITTTVDLYGHLMPDAGRAAAAAMTAALGGPAAPAVAELAPGELTDEVIEELEGEIVDD